MKTYVIEAIKRIKRFSEKFDVSTTLCDKTWIVFNDTGEREVYIFQPNGTVFITTDGVGIKGEWHWVSANKSLILNKDGNVIMLHPEFIDSVLLALTLDGTEEMVFLIDQDNKEAFIAKTLKQLEQYFTSKEQEIIKEENRRIEEMRYSEIQDKKKKEREEKEVMIYNQSQSILFNLKREKLTTLLIIFTIVFFVLLIEGIIIGESTLLIYICLGLFLLCLVAIKIIKDKNKIRIEEWKINHPNDPRNKYL